LASITAIGGTGNLYHLQLIKILGIDLELSDRGNKGLVWCYKKYKGFNAAMQLMNQMYQQGNWPLATRPGHSELVEVFMSRSYWHSHVYKPFSVIARFPQMVAWLERGEGESPSDFEVWHLQKSEYGFKELNEWIENNGTMDITGKRKLEKVKVKKTKGRAKAKGKGKEEIDEVDYDSEEESNDIEEEKRGKASGSKAKKTHKRK
jgi:hypothetical protein